MKRVAITAALLLSAITSASAVATADTSDDASVDGLLVSAGLVELEAAPAPLQEAKQAASAEVLVLFASNAKKGIDKCAAHLKALSQPPLSSYDSYACLSDKKLPLQLQTSSSTSTPDKGKISLHLNEVIRRTDKKPKYDVDVQVDKADGSKFVSTNVKAPEGKYFFLAGPKFEKDGVEGILVFAIQLQAP